MYDPTEEIERFSPFGGTLIREVVPGQANSLKVPENSVEAATGVDRDMFAYVPRTGCPDAKQCQVLMVLRDDPSEESARQLVESLELDKLAEDRHFVLLLPNPTARGWNYDLDPEREDDLSFLVRCFAVLPKSRGGVAGFNGMIFYLATTPAASALVASLAATRPLDCAAAFVGAFPQGYQMPAGAGAPQVAWVIDGNEAAIDRLARVNGPEASCDEPTPGIERHVSQGNPNVRHFVSSGHLDAHEVRLAWELMFSEARRWRNDTYGTYQKRTDFSARGFEAHVRDVSLGVNDGFAHTWYVYVPPQLRGTTRKVPLLFNFHGGNCVPLYCAEQSGWHDVADEQGFIVVYPRASTKKSWNVMDDADRPSDIAFVLALVKRMEETYPIDESRIYLSGFSMGSMMTNALACSYPELFAAAAPFNAQNLGYLSNTQAFMASFTNSMSTLDPEVRSQPSRTRERTDAKAAARAAEGVVCRMPLIQFCGMRDAQVGSQMPFAQPLTDLNRAWLETFDYWKAFNATASSPDEAAVDPQTGIPADEVTVEGGDGRFIRHAWHSQDEGSPSLYQMVAVKNMEHAIDLREVHMAWDFMRRFSRSSDGTLVFQN